MEADVAQERSVAFLNNARRLAAFHESLIFPRFGLCSCQVEGCFSSETLGFQRAPEAA